MNKIVFSAGCPLTLALSPEGERGKRAATQRGPTVTFKI
jgi:hypothetical protein